MALIDITGNTYGFLKVIGYSHTGKRNRSYWNCECQRCGKVVTLRKDRFIYPYSHTKSCGCWHREEASIRGKGCRNAVTNRFEKIEKEKLEEARKRYEEERK